MFLLGSVDRSPLHSSNHIPNALQLGITLVGSKKWSTKFDSRYPWVPESKRRCSKFKLTKNTPDTQPPPSSYKRYTQEDFFVGPDHLKNIPERKGKSSVPRPVILRFELLIFRGCTLPQKKTNNEFIPLIQKVWIRYPGWSGPGFCSI